MKTQLLRILLVVAVLCVGVNAALAFYDPGAQRWINRDPIGEDGGGNLFEFVANEPIALHDSFGHKGKRTCKEICKDAIADNAPLPGGGFVACEDGKKCGCVVAWPEVGYYPESCPDIDESIRNHEEHHFDEVDCPKKEPLCIPERKPGVDREKSECERAKADIKVLEKLSNKKKASSHCRDIAGRLLEYKKRYYEEHNCDSLLQKK